MSYLLYRQDVDEVYDRLTQWWNGGDIGRPAMQITVPRETPIDMIPIMPKPEGWVTHYSTSNFAYRLNLTARACIHTHYLAEAVPQVAPDLGANCLALYLGCTGVDQPGTVWFEPCIDRPDTARFEFAPDNFYWTFTLQLAREQIEIGKGKFLISFPDLIEGLDTLAAMRGTEALLFDLLERPAWVRDSLARITELYFEYYDRLYELIQDGRGGSHFWTWAPGRVSKFQCDFSAMISPQMFAELMVPVLTEMSERVDYCLYHWDGPGAIAHHDHLLSIPGITMLQWTPGAGTVPTTDKRWWPLYHKTIDAGKKIMIDAGGIDEIRALGKEFGPKLKQFMLMVRADTLQQADQIIGIVSD
ncbi:MAG: hypothetical protein JXA89_09475 [Anaerolineae bacterium]|nr:hypothetical protein [Anaerolineae bacterium]